MAKASRKASPKKAASKRTTIAPHGDKRYIRRDEKGRIKESDDVGTSLNQEKKIQAKNTVKPGHGDRGDVVPKKSASSKNSKQTGF